MRVRHILPGFGWVPQNPENGSMSGIVGVAYHLAHQQLDQGYATELIGLGDPRGAAGSNGAGTRQVDVTTVRPWALARIGPLDFRYVAPVAAQLALRPQADIHHIHTNPYLWWVGHAARRVLHYNTPVHDVSAAYVKAVNRTDAVICCSHFIRNQFTRHVDYPEQRIYVIPNGVDLDRFRPADRRACRQALGIGQDDLVVLFAGQVNHQKGLLHLVRACKALLPDLPAHLLVAGSSTLWRSAAATPHDALSPYERQVLDEARAITATFLGKVASAQMPAVYGAADVFVCPSVWDDPAPLVLREAMAAGLPIVATTAGGIPEFVEHNQTGILVRPGAVDDLARALRALLENPALRREMGMRGHARAQQFTWSSIAQRVRETYDAILAG